MGLSKDEKDRVRYHLGYPSVSTNASLQFGLPKPLQSLFLIEDAMLFVLPGDPEDRVRRIIKIMDDIECKLVDAEDFLVAEELGNMKLRDKHPDLLEKEYVRWGKRLADIFGVPIYPYAERYRTLFTGGSIPVRNEG
jgi:hypothetical protein